MLVAYLSAEIITPDDLLRYDTNIYMCVSNAQLYMQLLVMIQCVVKKRAFLYQNVITFLVYPQIFLLNRNI